MAIILTILLWLYVAAAVAYWAVAAWAMWRMGSSIVRLARAAPAGPPHWPRLSIIVPGCNEGDKMEAAARTLLAQDYPDLQIVLVDDRSGDETGAIVDRLAGEDGRVVAIHITELPAGWLGKVHALSRGLAASDGELVLLTDADVHYRPGTLRKAAAYFEARGLDHLAGLPGLWPSSAMLDGLIAAFIRQLMTVVQPWKASDPSSRRFMGGAVIAMLEAAPAVMPALLAAGLALPAGAALQAAAAALQAAAAAGLAVTAAFLVAAGMMARWSGGRILPPLLGPLLAGFAFFATARAAVLGLRRGGILWRGTLYTTDALRQGRRMRFFYTGSAGGRRGLA
jgi:hypothetical protein